MELQGARELMDAALAQHGLDELGWQGRFDEAKKRFGICKMREKIISLSRPLVLLNPEDEVRDTILHEIAHALAWERHRENCHHDARWRRICKEIGARAVATYDDEVAQPDLPWVLCHRATGEIFASFVRKPSDDPAHIWIRGRKKETLGQLKYAPNPKIRSAGAVDRFDRDFVVGFQDEVMETLQKLSDQWGISVERTSGSFTAGDFNLGVRFRAASTDGRSPEERDFAEVAPVFHLRPEDFHRIFRFEGKSYRLVALKPQNRKYPVIGMDPKGRRYKFPLSVVAAFRPTS